MNTSKQVNVMIGLLFLAFLVFGVYILNEGRRADAAADTQDALLAERGATLFVNGCRTCHGLEGQGVNAGGIAPQLNAAAYLILAADNPFGLSPTPDGEARNVREFLFNTISCGRTNTAMPAWSERYGGALSELQISYIVSMITQGRWDLVQKIGEEHDHDAKEQEAAAFAMFKKSYSAAADKPGALTSDEKKAVDAAIANGTATQYEDLSPEDRTMVEQAFFAGMAPDPSALFITTKNCGQYSGTTAKEFRDRNPFMTAPAAAATPTAAATAVPGGSAPAAGTVGVAMKEWAVAPAAAQTGPGSVQFDVKNAGVIPHEFVVVKTDAPFDRLAQKGGIVDESKVQVVGRADVFGAGEERKLTVTMQPGNYVLLCNVVGHYQLGMRGAFTVK